MNRLQAAEKRYANLKMLWARCGEENKRLQAEVEYLQGEIDKVPALLIYGNWDYKRCLFCKGKRGHKQGCIKSDE
jgi:hypothetical protein